MVELEKIEREHWVKQTRIYFGEDNIVYITVVGDADKQVALENVEIAYKFRKYYRGRIHMLLDLNKAGKPSAEARKIWAELHNDERTGRVAFYGLTPVKRIIASFIVRFSQNEPIKVFRTKEEALKWIKEDEDFKAEGLIYPIPSSKNFKSLNLF